jgi:hypothetical protein
MTIVEFLEARIAEDESDALTDAAEMDRSSVSIQFDCDTQARFSPARVLAECAAKRAIIAEHGLDDHSTKDYCETCADWWRSELGEGPPPVPWPCPTLSAVAAVYKDHPDYQQEWSV